MESGLQLRNYQNVAGVFVVLTTLTKMAIYWLPDCGEMARATSLQELAQARLPVKRFRGDVREREPCACSPSIIDELDGTFGPEKMKTMEHIAGCREGILARRELCRSKIFHYQSDEYLVALASVLGKMVHSWQLPVRENSVRCLIESNAESFWWRQCPVGQFFNQIVNHLVFRLFKEEIENETFITLSRISARVTKMTPAINPTAFICKASLFSELEQVQVVERESARNARFERDMWMKAYGDTWQNQNLLARALRIGGKTVLAIARFQVATEQMIDMFTPSILAEIRRFAMMGLVHRNLTREHVAFMFNRVIFLSLGHVEQVQQDQIRENVDTFIQIMMEKLQLRI
jgi:hypothetical protein